MPETAAARSALSRCLEHAWPVHRPILREALEALEAGRSGRALALLGEASLKPSPAALMLARRDAKRALRTLLATCPVVCAWCKTVIRRGDGRVSHGMCDDCLDAHYPPHLETEGERQIREGEGLPEDAA